MADDRWNESRAQWDRARRFDTRDGRPGRGPYGEDPGLRSFGETGRIRGAGPYEGGASGDRDFESAQRRRHNGDYDPDRYTPNPREGRGEEPRTWWNRTQDELSSWLGDNEARRRREWDEYRTEFHGEGEHRGRGPKGYRRADARIHDDINDRLTDDPYLNASGIEVSVSEGEATLSGHVLRRDDKRRAEDLAERVSGVIHVQNTLRVRPVETQSPSATDVLAEGH
jgi:hypothetical protein